MYIDERSRDSLRDERYGDYDDGRYHERLTVPSRLLTVREESRQTGRRGSREHKEMYERSGHRDVKLVRSGSRGGERGGSFSLTKDDRRPSFKDGRSPRRTHMSSERSKHTRHEPASHPAREGERERQYVRGREERKERHPRGHRHRDKIEKREVSSVVANVAEMENISSESGEEEAGSKTFKGGSEKIEELIRDLESGSSSGEMSEEESDEGGAKRGKKAEADEEHDLHSEKDKSSDGMQN